MRTRTLLLLTGLLVLAACRGEGPYARVQRIQTMAQTIGGPAAMARPGDILLENDKIRAVVHARRNQRSTFPLGNGSLVDLDLQRPQARFGNGKGADVFYELGPMVNLQISSSTTIQQGACTEVGGSPCPTRRGAPDERCARVSTEGSGDTIFGILGLLDLAILRSFNSSDLRIATDYDVCPGESFVRITTTARFSEGGSARDIPELPDTTSLLAALLGEHSGIDCARSTCPPTAPHCDDLLINLSLGDLSTEMKRCRTDTDGLAGLLAGDFTFFSAKARIFLPGLGFDHETQSRSIFDTGGDIFSNPMTLDWVAAVGDDVSYAYFNQGGKLMVPIFSAALSVAMTNRLNCPRNDPGCFRGERLRFRRFVGVGQGDVASALEPFYALRQIPVGRVAGHVVDLRSRRPLSRAEVFVFRLPAAWESLGPTELGGKTYAELVAAHRAETMGPASPIGQVGLVSHFRSDPGVDTVLDGSFGGALPAGRYLLMTRDADRPPSALVPITVEVGKTTRTAVFAGDPAILEFEIRDAAGRALPSKLTLGHCFPECARAEDCADSSHTCDPDTHLCTPSGGFTRPEVCRPDQVWDQAAGSCRCPDTGRLPLELGGARFADGTVRTVHTASGKGRVMMAPGTYQVVASRGIEYEISKHFVTLQGGTVSRLTTTLPRVVDTTGWISADFHVHGPNSVDASARFSERVVSYAVEGVDLVVATDHDYETDYGPTIFALGLDPWLASDVGVEVSPLDYGHFIGFPLRFNENEDLNGAFHWRTQAASTNPDWRNLKMGEIFDMLRERGRLGRDKTVVFIAHFYDNFAFYDIDPWTLEPPALGITAIFNPVLNGANFSGEFDALELLNGKNFDIVRRPSYAEVRTYNVALNALVAQPLTFTERLGEWAKISAASQRSFLRRTQAEQVRGLDYHNSHFVCRCVEDLDCGPGSFCAAASGGCVRRCANAGSCDAERVAAGREACLPLPGGDATRTTCQRATPTCATDADCTFGWGGGASERCVAADPAAPASLTCQIRCTSDDVCERADDKRPICDVARGFCVAAPAAGDDDPCPTLRGTLDDWFQMLNRGMRRTILANSDSHSTYDVEAGIPRNYVGSTATSARAIRIEEVVSSVKSGRSLATYGPFVEVSLNGAGMGSTVTIQPGGQVELTVRVRSPRWFDVDRLEIYRNGELWQTVAGRVDCARDATDCIKVPNDQVVNFAGKFTDTPSRDSWYVVVAMGLDGKSMAPVYSSTPVSRLGAFELIQRLTPLLPPLRSLRIPFSPTISVVRPYAVTNAIWVDVGGDGFTPLAGLPSWATAADQAGVTGPGARRRRPSGGDPHPAHGVSVPRPGSAAPRPRFRHDHRWGLGRLRREARDLMNLLRKGKLTRKRLLQALGRR